MGYFCRFVGGEGLDSRGFGSGGVRAPGTEQISQRVVLLSELVDGGRPRALIPGEGVKGWLGGARLGGSRVGGRGTGPRDGANFATPNAQGLRFRGGSGFLSFQKEEKWLFLKDALWGGGGGYPPELAFFEGCPVRLGGGTHRSWPGGRGDRPRALIPDKGVREGLAWQLRGVQGLRFRGG